ncbi:hypothetical protein B0O80DRAFT_454063 [Mortierella sp. GBAus27b]|nr:hypothetical protein B0O80DRAFT_454063 [Mortierella sp. GBAus27b]
MQQQLQGWYKEHGDDPSLLEDLVHHTQYYDDDENGDSDPYYIADNKGRAQAFEGVDAANIKAPQPAAVAPPAEESKKKWKRPTLAHKAASYSYERSHHTLAFTPENGKEPIRSLSNDQMVPSNYSQDYIVSYDTGAQVPFDHTIQTQHARYVDPHLISPMSPMSPGSTSEPGYDEDGKPRSKTKWFGKKKKRDGSVETFDEVAKLMDEALFGNGTMIPRKASKTKGKDKDKERDMDFLPTIPDGSSSISSSDSNILIPPNSLPMILPPKEPLPDLDTCTFASRRSSMDASSMTDQQSFYSDGSHQPPFIHIPASEPQNSVPQVPTTPKALLPVAYAPRTTYTPLVKKQAQSSEDVNEEADTVPEYAPETPLETKPLEETKKFKNLPFNMFKIKKKNGQDQENMNSPICLSPGMMSPSGEDISSFGQSGQVMGQTGNEEPRSIDLVLVSPTKTRKKRDSEEYVPYEYQEELEGPLMERVEVPENREFVGFVMPVKELGEYSPPRNGEMADTWDSWVNQLESFEKVLSEKEKGTKNIKKSLNKRFKRSKRGGTNKSGTVVPKGSSPPLPPLPLIALRDQDDRSSILSNSTLGRRPSTNSSLLGMNDDQYSERPSFQSTRSAVMDLTVHQVSSQLAKKRWWDPKRKEATSIYAPSLAEQDQEKYLATLLQNHQDDEPQADYDDAADEEGHDYEREDALNALLENSRTIMSLPIPIVESRSPSPVSTRDLASISGFGGSSSSIKTMTTTTTMTESRPVTAPQSPIMDSGEYFKSNKSIIINNTGAKPKPKLLPISTPLAQILQLSNAEELWQYVQQAKTYAAAKMNKGDKRSAAIALKRAQALEARWQQVLLEMASSEGDEDEILLDDEEEVEDGEYPSAVALAASAAGAAFLAKKSSTDTLRRQDEYLHEDSGDDIEQARRRMYERQMSRSDNAPNMYSKYKVNKAAPLSKMSSYNSLASKYDSQDEEERQMMRMMLMKGLLGPDATLDQMLATTNREHLEIYIQRLKTDTVAKARSGSKFAALQSMKNVKMLQQRLQELEDDDDDEDDEDDDDYEDEEDQQPNDHTTATTTTITTTITN